MAGPWATKALSFPMIGTGGHVKGAENKLSGAVWKQKEQGSDGQCCL